MRSRASTVPAFGLLLAGLGTAACGKQELVSAPVYTLPAAVGHASDTPAKATHTDGGYLMQKQPMSCQPENPPHYCQTLTDCQSGDICISYTCEPACYSQCGDFPPGLPNCPNPLVCQNGVCVPPLVVTSSSGTTTGGTGKRTSTTTGGNTIGGNSSNGGGSTGGSSGSVGTTGTVGTVGTTGTTGGAGTTTTTGGGTTGSAPPLCNDPDISGDWTMTSNYYIATGVAGGYPGLLGIINEVSNFLNTWAYAFAVPSWVPLIFNDLSGFDALFENLNVVSDMELVTDDANTGSYTATETWNQVSVIVQGQQTQLQPQDGYDSPNPYGVVACNGTTTLANHDISGSVTGLIGPLLDAIVQADCEIQGCSYGSFSDLMTGIIGDLIDCSQLNDGSIFGSIAEATCDSAEQSVVNDITNAIAKIPLGIGICSVNGSAPTDPQNLVGNWNGNVSGTPFPGNFQASHN